MAELIADNAPTMVFIQRKMPKMSKQNAKQAAANEKRGLTIACTLEEAVAYSSYQQKFQLRNKEDTEKKRPMLGLQEQRTSWTSQRQRRDQCHKDNGVDKMHCAINRLIC